MMCLPRREPAPGAPRPRAAGRACPGRQAKHLVKGRVVTNRTGVTALATLAMLNVFTLGAGVAVANLLPERLALFQVPRVATARLEAPRPVLAPAGPRGPVPDRGRLAALLGPLIAAHPLGKHVGAGVTHLGTGTVPFSRDAG